MSRGMSTDQIISVVGLLGLSIIVFGMLWQGDILWDSTTEMRVNVGKEGYRITDSMYTLLASPADTETAEIPLTYDSFDLEIKRESMNLTVMVEENEYSIGVPLFLGSEIYFSELDGGCDGPGKLIVEKKDTDRLEFDVECGVTQ